MPKAERLIPLIVDPVFLVLVRRDARARERSESHPIITHSLPRHHSPLRTPTPPFILYRAVNMPKVSKVGRFRANEKKVISEVAADSTKDGATATDTNVITADKQALSRGQRKRAAKREQYLKREKMVMASLKLKKQDEQRGRLDGLDALRDALISSDKSGAAAQRKGGEKGAKESAAAPKPVPCSTNRAKKNLAGREVAHMNLVLEHPSFKANPFATLQEHLRNTLSGQADELKQSAETEAAKEKQEVSERKKAKKEKIRDLGGKKILIRKKKRLAKQQQQLQAETSGRGSKRGRRR